MYKDLNRAPRFLFFRAQSDKGLLFTKNIHRIICEKNVLNHLHNSQNKCPFPKIKKKHCASVVFHIIWLEILIKKSEKCYTVNVGN